MSKSVTVYLGIGANLGDKVQTILDAKHGLLAYSWVNELRSSSLYWSSPVGYDDQPSFINAVFALNVNCTPRDCFSAIQAIERKLGRQRDPSNQNAPRVIDIDLLAFGEHTIQEPDLEVPHPRLWQRRFVLEPLLELDPDALIAGRSVAKFYRTNQNTFVGQDIHRLGPAIGPQP